MFFMAKIKKLTKILFHCQMCKNPTSVLVISIIVPFKNFYSICLYINALQILSSNFKQYVLLNI